MSAHTGRDTILYAADTGNKSLPPDIAFHLSIEQNDLQGFMASLHELKRQELDLVLHSGGGSLEAAEKIVNYLRCKYSNIRAIIPDRAMSAATMIACACDSIVMAKHSAIGPIDPQFVVNGTAIPANAILEEFAMARNEVSKNPNLAFFWAQRFQSLPPGFLDQCRIESERSAAVVAKWLLDRMLKGKTPDEVAAVAKWLSDREAHKSHGRPICAQEASDAGLKVELMEKDATLQNLVLSLYHTTMLTFEQSPTIKIIENHAKKGFYVKVQQMTQQRSNGA